MGDEFSSKRDGSGFVNSNPNTYDNILYPTSSQNFAYAIAPYWDDLNPGGSGNKVYVKNATDFWVISWEDVRSITGQIVGTFEVILYSSGSIKFQYVYISYIGGGYTAGLNYGNWNISNSYSSLDSSTTDLAIKFAPLPPLAVSTPNDFTYLAGTTDHSVNWTVTAGKNSTTSYVVARNGTPIASGEWVSGQLISISTDGLANGSYNFSIRAEDGLGGIVEDDVIVGVVNLLLTHPSDVAFLNGTSISPLSWVASSGFALTTSFTIYSNGTPISSGSWESGESVAVSITGFDPGQYNVTWLVEDGLGNITQDEVWVGVSDLGVMSPPDVNYTIGINDPILQWAMSVTVANPGIYMILRNGTQIDTNFWTNDNPVILGLEGLTLGSYNFTIIANDVWGVSVQATTIVSANQESVTPPPFPNISHPSDTSYVVGTKGHTIMWNITAAPGANGTYTIYINGTVVAQGTWQTPSGHAIISTSTDLLLEGDYLFEVIMVENGSGFTVHDMVLVTITPESDVPDFTIWWVIAIICVGVIGVAGIYWTRKRRKTKTRQPAL